MTNAALRGKPDAGNPHVRFDEGEVAPAATPRRGSLLYKKTIGIWTLVAFVGGLGCGAWGAVEAPAPASAYVSPEFLAPSGDGAGVFVTCATGRKVMEVALDGVHGECILEPDEQQKKEYLIKRAEFIKQREMLQIYKGKETVTADGEKLMLFGNIGKPEDASQVLLNDGEGIGLFRTEFLFMGASKLPTEEEQFAAYKQAAEIMAGKSVIIRTLDVGGDKDIPYLGLEKEDNPFLGFRAVRYCLKNEDVYKVQLRALLRASAFGDVKIMIPLVTCVEEVRAVKALVKKLMAELDAEGRKYNKDIEIGVMIETPAASLIADLLAKEADFFSIGTNDLTQYTMAVDRGNARVSYLYSAYNPAVLRSMKHIIETGKAAGITVGMCGEAAADPLLIPLLVSFGLDEYSVSATSVLATRGILSKWSKKEADELAEKALSLSTEAEVAELLKEAQK